MAPIRYSLHYEDYSEHLMSRFGKLLQMQSLVDMTLMCSSHTLRVHKAVLAASSAYFQEVLQKQIGEPLIILKMRFSVLKCLVEFMYCGKTQCLEENLDELVSAAQFLKIKGLSKVTKEGLGITNSGDPPEFTPPVVINRPPQSLTDIISQESDHKTTSSQLPPTSTASQPLDSFGRPNKDTSVVRIPFDIDNGSNSTNVDYPDMPRTIKPRRGRPSARRSGGWEGPGALGRAAERALLRREQDSRKAIHQLKHLQTRHMQDYMDRVTLSQAVSSICGPEPSNYINMDNDLMYMDNNVTNVMDQNTRYGKENSISDIPSSYTSTNATNSNDNSGDGISNAMSQYVTALKNAGLPTDLPILFESGDGSYINVNEQVLLDMVQSSEIQYEVIEQPNIIEKVADPSEIKSIDDLSKSIERGEMMLGNKGYSATNDYNKNSEDYSRTEDSINGLNNILPDNLDSFTEQQNFVVLDSQLTTNNSALDTSNDFSCIDGDMQFFTKSISDDVNKYYADQQLNSARVMEQLCPTSNSIDTNFSISLLDAKSSQLTDNLNQQFNRVDDMRRNEDCYDFSLPLAQNNDFKEDLDCLIATPRRNDDDYEMNNQLDRERAQAKEDIIKDLMSIESKINMTQSNSGNENTPLLNENNIQEFPNLDELNENEDNQTQAKDKDISESVSASLQWDGLDISDESCRNDPTNNHEDNLTPESEFRHSVIDLTEAGHVGKWDGIMQDGSLNKENVPPTDIQDDTDIDNDIPFAVGLLPMKQSPTDESNVLKRKSSIGLSLLENVDKKCLRRRAKRKL